MGINDLLFANAPVFGSYDLRKRASSIPSINLEESCYSSNLQDDSEVGPKTDNYQVGDVFETLSCSEAFEMHKSMYSGDVCNFGYQLNDQSETLLDRCGETFCSECAQVENTNIINEDLIYAKEIYENELGYEMAPGFEISYSQGKKQGLVGMAAPTPMADFDDVSLPSLPAQPAKSMPAPLLIPDVNDVVVEGMQAPSFQDTAFEENLEAPMMQVKTSMVPPGTETNDVSKPQRLSRY